MSINSFIREIITRTDTILNMYDTSDLVYGTRNPTKSQHLAINRTITTVADDINIVAIHSFDRAT